MLLKRLLCACLTLPFCLSLRCLSSSRFSLIALFLLSVSGLLCLPIR
ncbi:MAG: hypothetical protein REDVDVYQ_001830, partial [Candidatus Fervidibacter sp.]